MMKMELTFKARAFSANLCRRRAAECRDNAATAAIDSQRVEWEEEATYAEKLAFAYDDGEELVIKRPRPITANPMIDIEAIGVVDHEKGAAGK